MAGLLTSLVVALAASSGARRTIQVEPSSVLAGQPVTVHGVVPGCRAPNRVTLISKAFNPVHEFAGVPAVYALVGRHNRYSITARVPATRKAGRYTITGRCGGGNLGVTAHVSVYH